MAISGIKPNVSPVLVSQPAAPKASAPATPSPQPLPRPNDGFESASGPRPLPSAGVSTEASAATGVPASLIAALGGDVARARALVESGAQVRVLGRDPAAPVAPRPEVPPQTISGIPGEYMIPEGDGFTGTKNGMNFFRGHLWAAEGLAQGGGTGPVKSFAFVNYLRHHLPLLNATLPPGSPERVKNEELLGQIGGATVSVPDQVPAPAPQAVSTARAAATAESAAATSAPSAMPDSLPGIPHEYMTPTGDGFTGTRNGMNFFRGHLWAAEGLAQGGGTGPVHSFAFVNYLRHHLPILNSVLPPGSPERQQNDALLAQIGGPTTSVPENLAAQASFATAAPGLERPRPNLAGLTGSNWDEPETAPIAVPKLPVTAMPDALPGIPAEYLIPEGDGFTGTRGGMNYFRGHLWAAEGLAQGGGTASVQSFAYANWLRHHLPILNATLPVDSPERRRNDALLAELGAT